MSEKRKFDPHNAAIFIRGILGVQGRKQTELARKLGLNRVVINMYLNRKLNLLPEDIESILDELGVKEKAEKVCGLNHAPKGDAKG